VIYSERPRFYAEQQTRSYPVQIEEIEGVYAEIKQLNEVNREKVKSFVKFLLESQEDCESSGEAQPDSQQSDFVHQQ